jgi:hypothetical protein
MLNEVGIRAKLHTQDQDSGFAAIQNGKVGMYIFGRGSVSIRANTCIQYFRTESPSVWNFPIRRSTPHCRRSRQVSILQSE